MPQLRLCSCLHVNYIVQTKYKVIIMRIRGIKMATLFLGYFNWSFSYRLDAKFPTPYGQFTKVPPTLI